MLLSPSGPATVIFLPEHSHTSPPPKLWVMVTPPFTLSVLALPSMYTPPPLALALLPVILVRSRTSDPPFFIMTPPPVL